LTPEEFTQLVLIAAAPPNRVGELVARLAGERITIGQIAVGPGGMGSATGWGTRGQVHVASCLNADWHQRGAVQVQSRFRLRLDRPYTVSVDIEEVQVHHIRTAVNPVGSRCFTASGCGATSTSSKRR
jgi:hypothetical protein